MTDAGRDQLRDAYLDQQIRLEARGEWLESPEAEQQRLSSRAAYRGFDDDEAVALFRQLWASELVPPLPDAETLIGDDRVSGFLDERSMRVTGLDGRSDRLVVSELPLRAVDASGESQPTDVDLVRDGDAFVPDNSTADIEIPVVLDDGARVDRVTVTPAGEALGTKVDGDTVIYPNVERDTDVALVSTLTGVETFHQLRSDLAPEELRIDIAMPAGAKLEASPAGGAVIVDDSGPVASVSPVTALDAQGEPVDATLRVEGSVVVVAVDHRGEDVAYPILVDPFVEEDWARNGTTNTTGTWYHQNAAALNGIPYWGYNYSGNVSNGLYAPRAACYAPVAYTCYSPTHNGSSWDGLHMLVRSWTFYPANSWAQWYYNVPGYSTRINRVDWGAMHLRPATTEQYPIFFYGIWSGPQNNYIAQRTFSNATAGGAVNNITHDWYAQFAGTHAGPHALVAGWWTPVNTTPSAWRDGYIGGMVVQLTDPDQPTDLSVARTGPTGWTNGASLTAAPEARDAGVGMKSFTLRVPASSSTGSEVQTRTHPCTGRRGSECPSYDYRQPPAAGSRSWKLPDSTIAGVNGTAFSYSVADANPSKDGAQPMPEGVNTVTLEARDIIHGDQVSTNTTWQVKVDRTAPSPTLTGVNSQELLLDQDYFLTASGNDALSGITQMSVKLDGQTKATTTSCSTTACPISWSLDGGDANLTDGMHTLQAVAKDAAGNVGTVTKSVWIDRTAPNVNYAGGLDSSGDWIAGSEQGLRMVATDDATSNAPAAGASKVELLVDGAPLVSETSAECVDATCSIDVRGAADLSTLPLGDHEIAVAGVDRAGNKTTRSWPIKIDNRAPTSEMSGSLFDATFDSAAEGLHVSALDGDLLQQESEAVAITLAIDGHEVDRVDRDTSECVFGGCPLAHDFVVEASSLTAGKHEVALTVIDAVGNAKRDAWTIDVPTTLAGSVCPGVSTSTGEAIPAAQLVSPADARAAIEQEAPAVIAPSEPTSEPEVVIDPTIQVRPESVASDGSLVPAEADAELADGIEVGDPNEPVCLAPVDTAPNASEPLIVGGDAALVANSQAGVDTVIRPTAVGVETLLHIREPSATQQFSWTVSTPPGQSLEQVAPGLIAIVDSGGAPPAELYEPIEQTPPATEGDTDIDDDFDASETEAPPEWPGATVGVTAAEQRDAVPLVENQLDTGALAVEQAESATDKDVVGVISAPWATDAADASVPVTLTLSGNQVTMTVDHANATFPVIADPVYVKASAANVVRAAAVDMNDCPGGKSPCGSYNAGAAAAYARRHGANYNLDFQYFGFDCTNFASQVLWAGGMNFMREYGKGQGSWWALHGSRRGDSTDSWRLAAVFRNHLLEYALAVHTHTWHVGDVIYWDWHDGGSAVDHISLVSDISGGTVYIANHSSKGGDANYGRKPWSEVKKRAAKAHPNYTFQRLHIRHTKANIN